MSTSVGWPSDAWLAGQKGRIARPQTTRYAASADWTSRRFARPSTSRKSLPEGYAGTTPSPTSFVTTIVSPRAPAARRAARPRAPPRSRQRRRAMRRSPRWTERHSDSGSASSSSSTRATSVPRQSTSEEIVGRPRHRSRSGCRRPPRHGMPPAGRVGGARSARPSRRRANRRRTPRRPRRRRRSFESARVPARGRTSRFSHRPVNTTSAIYSPASVARRHVCRGVDCARRRVLDARGLLELAHFGLAERPHRTAVRGRRAAMGPKLVRWSSITGCPTAENIRRTCRLRPSRIVISTVDVAPASQTRTSAGAVRPSSSSTPL